MLNSFIMLLSRHKPYMESDHSPAQAYNLFNGANCLEDSRRFQYSSRLKKIVGSKRMPAPSTSGDFLWSFSRGMGSAFQEAIDFCRCKVSRSLSLSKRQVSTIDIDPTIKPVYGECKEGADFSYEKNRGYRSLIVTLEETIELLRVVNGPGSSRWTKGVLWALRGDSVRQSSRGS